MLSIRRNWMCQQQQSWSYRRFCQVCCAGIEGVLLLLVYLKISTAVHRMKSEVPRGKNLMNGFCFEGWACLWWDNFHKQTNMVKLLLDGWDESMPLIKSDFTLYDSLALLDTLAREQPFHFFDKRSNFNAQAPSSWPYLTNPSSIPLTSITLRVPRSSFIEYHVYLAVVKWLKV